MGAAGGNSAHLIHTYTVSAAKSLYKKLIAIKNSFRVSMLQSMCMTGREFHRFGATKELQGLPV